MAVSLGAYKYLLHVSLIQDTLVQGSTHIRVLSRQGQGGLTRWCCGRFVSKPQAHTLAHQASLTLPPTSLTSQHTHSRSSHSSASAQQTNLTLLHTSLTSQYRTLTSLPSSHTSPQTTFPASHTSPFTHPHEETPLTQAVQVMMNVTPEERNPKRPREQDATVSPPAKKTQHRQSSLEKSDVGGCVEEVKSLAATLCQHPGETGLTDGDVIMSEEGGLNKESTPIGEKSKVLNSKGGSPMDVTQAGRTEMEAVSLDRKMKEEVRHEGEPDRGVKAEKGRDMDLASVLVAVKRESLPEKQTDIKPLCVRKTESIFSAQEAEKVVKHEEETTVHPTLKEVAVKREKKGESLPEKQGDIDFMNVGKSDSVFSPVDSKRKDTPREGMPTDSAAVLVAAKIESQPAKETHIHSVSVRRRDKGFTHKEPAREGTARTSTPKTATVKSEPVTDMQFMSIGETKTAFTHKEPAREGTARTSTTKSGTASSEQIPDTQTDMESMHTGTTDKASVHKEEGEITETNRLLRNHDPQTHTSAMPPEPDQHTDSPLGTTDIGAGLLEGAKGRMSAAGEEGRSQQTKEKKRSSQRSKKRKHSGDKKNLRPNYFVGVQISNPAIHRGLLMVQEDLVAWDEGMVRALVDIATSHITLLVAHIDGEEPLAVACAALEESAKRLQDGINDWPLRLTFSGVNNFSNQVVFACVEEDDQHQRLLDMAECVRRVFEERGVCMPDTRELHPHLTIAKLSKAPRNKGKPGVKKIDPACYSHHHDLHFGTQTVAGLQLLSMNKAKDDCRYYHSDKEVLFDVSLDEGKDHSACCFPRRPTLPITQRRAFTTATATTLPTEEEEEEAEERSHGRWMVPVAGVATLVAAALVIGFALARVRGSQ